MYLASPSPAKMTQSIQHLILSFMCATAVLAQGVPPPGSVTIMLPVPPTPFPTSAGHHHELPQSPHHHISGDTESTAMNSRDLNQGDWNRYNDADRGGGGSLRLACPRAGFFCESTLIDYTHSRFRPRPMMTMSTSMSTPKMTPKAPMDSSARAALVGVFGGIGGGEGGGSQKANDYFVCPAGNRQDPVLIAKCPQMGCQRDYCVGGGPATVPRKLESGDGLYCGKTIRRTLSLDQDRDVGNDGDGDPSEYLRNNLYYFAGSHGVNLGPCPGRCVNAGPGVSDYCEA